MRKSTFIIILFISFISCQEKTKEVQKTYEQLEAEVLCDVLPDVIKDYCKNQPQYLPKPIETDSISFTQKQLDSINSKDLKDWQNLQSLIRQARDSFIKQIPEHKKVTFGVVDSLWNITSEKIKEQIIILSHYMIH